MGNKENKIAVDARWKKVSECEEKENSFQLLSYKFSWWGHCGWQREVKCSERSPAQLLQVVLVGISRRFIKQEDIFFTCRRSLKEYFLPEVEGLGLTHDISVICSVCSCKLCSGAVLLQHWDMQLARCVTTSLTALWTWKLC